MIDCLPEKQSILAAIKKLYSVEFQTSLQRIRNPYEEEGTINKILQLIKNMPLTNWVKKPFFDIQFSVLA
ncbi:hypothetical protein FJ364_05935 [Candidatus Dependentiae bacterium]|nr:hypothetical protein [Candidatus Dependentiae bacterium]